MTDGKRRERTVPSLRFSRIFAAPSVRLVRFRCRYEGKFLTSIECRVARRYVGEGDGERDPSRTLNAGDTVRNCGVTVGIAGPGRRASERRAAEAVDPKKWVRLADDMARLRRGTCGGTTALSTRTGDDSSFSGLSGIVASRSPVAEAEGRVKDLGEALAALVVKEQALSGSFCPLIFDTDY